MKFPRYILLTTILLLPGVMQHQSYAQKKKRKEENKEITKYERANAEYLFIEAQKFFLVEDYARAITYLNQSLEIDKDNDAAYFKLAEIYLLTGKNTEGIEAIEKAINFKKDNRYYYILAAQLHKATNDLATAAAQYEQMVANTSNYKEFLLDMSDLYVALGDYEKAINTLNLTEKEYRTPDKFASRKKELMLQNGQSQRAIDYLASVVRKRPANLQFAEEYISLLSDQNQTETAISYLEDQAQSTPALKPLLASLYIRNGIEDKASTLLQELFSTNQTSSTNRLRLIQEIVERPAESTLPLAADQLNKLLQSTPNNATVLGLQSQVLSLNGNTGNRNATSFDPETLQVLVRLVKNDPATLDHWKQLLTYQYDTEHWNDLLDYSEQSLDYFPNQGLFYFYYGSAALYAKDMDEATDLLTQALRLSSRSDSLKARIYGKQSEIAFMNGDTEKAKSLFSQATALLNHPEIINNYSFRLALQKTDLDAALNQASNLVQQYPDQLKYRRTLAFVYFQSANFTRAKQLLEEGLSQLPTQINGQARELYGDILIKLDLVDEALAEWQKAKTLGNTSDKLNQKIANKEYFE